MQTTITLEITLAGETRPVEFTRYQRDGDVCHSGHVFAGRIGRGQKRHAISVMAVLLNEDTNERVDRSYGSAVRYTDAEGNVWGVQSSGFALNRQARVIGWYAPQDTGNSQHIGSRWHTDNQTQEA